MLVKDKDRDYDGRQQGPYDADDYKILAYGHAASSAEQRQIVARLRTYYLAAAAHNGGRACALMSKAAAKATIDIYGTWTTVRKLAPNQTCGTVTTNLFMRLHRQMALDSATLVVKGVRLGPALGYALLSFKGRPYQHMLLYREAGVWRIDAALDDELV